MAAGTVRDWLWDDVRSYVRANGKDIKKLALQGDKIAIAVMSAYYKAARAPRLDGTLGCSKGSKEHLSLCDALNDYVIRDLLIRERIKLAEKFGHRVKDEHDDPKLLLLH